MPAEARGKAVPKHILTGPQVPVTVLLLSGLLLVVLGQSLLSEINAGDRWLLYLLIVAGLLSFALAGQLILPRRPPRRLVEVGLRLANFLDVSKGQLTLLLVSPCFGLMAALAAGEKLQALNPPISLLAWLLAVVTVLVGSYRPDEAATGLERKKLARKELALLVALFVVAFLIRALGNDSLPPTLSGDEAASGLIAAQFLTGEANNPFTVGWFSFPSLYFALQSLGIAALGQTAAGLRITSALAGALTVVGLYWMARMLFDRTTALIAAVFLTIFHYHIHFSRIGLNNIWDGFFVVIVLGAWWHGWRNGKRSSFLLCGLALGLGQYFYVSVRVVPLLLLIWSAAALLTDRQTFRGRIADMLLVGYIAFIVTLPLHHFYLDHPAEFNAPLQRVTILDSWLQKTLEGEQALETMWHQVSATALGFTHLALRHLYNPGSPLLLAGTAGLFLLGLVWAVTHMDLRYFLILLPMLAVVVLGSLSLDPPASQRYVIAVPTVATLVALPLVVAVRWLRGSQSAPDYVLAFGVAVIVVWIAYVDLRYYFQEVYREYVLGGLNTEVATSMAHFLGGQEPIPDVYFFGHPRMGYYSLSTLPFLVPDVQAVDVLEPLTDAPRWELARPTSFIFLPEREQELSFVRVAYPGGETLAVSDEDGDSTLFVVYEVPSRRSAFR